MEHDLIGFDDTFEELDPVEDESDIRETLASNLSDAIVQGTDWTTSTLLDQINRQRIQLNPNFQRRDAWTETRKSRFIESGQLLIVHRCLWWVGVAWRPTKYFNERPQRACLAPTRGC
jgi:hypothetical protein